MAYNKKIEIALELNIQKPNSQFKFNQEQLNQNIVLIII